MEKKYEEIAHRIKHSYESGDFQEGYTFYKGRDTKNIYRTGIIDTEIGKFFFKILDKEEYNDESNIRQKINPHFTTVDKYLELDMGSDILNLYQYIDAVDLNAFNYLRNAAYPVEEKEKRLDYFFGNMFDKQDQYAHLEIMDGTRKSDRWFFGRIQEGSRITQFYGKNQHLLLEDIASISPECYTNFYKFFQHLQQYLKDKHLTVNTYSHGDFHDFNFSLDGLYWDIDTFDDNPMLNDLVIYFWHFYAREDSLIYAYSPWLVPNMHNELLQNELEAVRGLKKKEVIRWLTYVREYFQKYGIEDHLDDEFVFKLFCRMFLIENIFQYSEEERRKVYQYFDFILTNQENHMENILFESPIQFSLKKG